jgi:hypothetical protein
MKTPGNSRLNKEPITYTQKKETKPKLLGIRIGDGNHIKLSTTQIQRNYINHNVHLTAAASLQVFKQTLVSHDIHKTPAVSTNTHGLE